MRKWLIMLSLCLMLPLAAHAELERTVWVWDSRTPDQGKITLDLGTNFETWKYATADAQGEFTGTSAGLSYGIRDNWSVGIEAGYARQRITGDDRTVYYKGDGAADIYVKSTYRILDESRSGMDLAFRGYLGIPTADEDKFGSGNWEPRLEMIWSKTLGKVLAVTNFGIAHIIDSEEGENNVTVNADLECILPLGQQVSLSGFFSTGTTRWEDDPNDAYYIAGTGIRFAPTKSTYLSGTVARSLFMDDINDDWIFVLRMGFEF